MLRAVLCALLGHLWRWHPDPERPPAYVWCERCGQLAQPILEEENHTP
jgi:hypothetical protein